MAKIIHIGYGYLTHEGEDAPIVFQTSLEAIEYLAHCGEADNIGTDWDIEG